MNAEILLKENKLQKTKSRILLLELFLNNRNKALSEKELEDLMEGKTDRATIFRNLNTFCQNNLLHKLKINNESRYAISLRDHVFESLNDIHAHFYCSSCHAMKCIEGNLHLDKNLPGGYEIEKTDVVHYGTCKACNTNNLS